MPAQTKQSVDAEVIRIPQDKLVSGIVTGLANASLVPFTPRKKTDDIEVSEELIAQVIDQYQEQKSQQPENPSKRNQEAGQKQNSERSNLHAIIAKYLLGKSSTENQQTQQNSQNPILTANDMVNQQSNQSSNQQSNNQQGNNQQGGSQQNLINSDVTAKMASQVLAEAQYELANELETSLNKLQRVIEESRQIAQKISNILGQQNGNSGNNNN
jgi:hypothetical protein